MNIPAVKRPNRLLWILQKLQEGDRRVFDFDIPTSPSTKFSDATLLEKLGYISVKRNGKWDSQSVLHLLKMPTLEELKEAYLIGGSV